MSFRSRLLIIGRDSSAQLALPRSSERCRSTPSDQRLEPWRPGVNADYESHSGSCRCRAGRSAPRCVFGQEPTGCGCGDLLPHGGLGVPVELLKRFGCWESGGTDPQLRTGCVSGGDFTVKHCSEVLLVGPARIAGVVGQPGSGLGDSWRLQRRGQVVDLLDRLAAAGDGGLRRRHLGNLPVPGEPLDQAEGTVVVGQVPTSPSWQSCAGRAGG